MRYFSFIALLFFSFLATAQTNLFSNVYLFNLESNEGKLSVHSPKFLTEFNKNGYNNQPSFASNDEILMSVKLASSNQTDIYSFNTRTHSRQQITNTSLSEYSPILSPDKKHISCVRVDDAATSLQRVYNYEYVKNGIASSPLMDIKNVGYFAWLDASNIALFLVNKPNQIALVNTNSKDPLIFSSDIGRCLQINAKGNLIYVHKITDEFWYIKEYDQVNQKASIVSETIPGSEDFAITGDGVFIMGKDSKLFYLDPAKSKTWSEIGDLSFFGIKNIKRLAIKGNQLALVDQAK